MRPLYLCQRYCFFTADAANLAGREGECPEVHILSLLFGILCTVEYGVVVAGLFEAAGVHRAAYPFLVIGVCGNLLNAAAHLLLLACVRGLHPLVVLHRTAQFDSLAGETRKLVIRQHLLCCGVAGSMNQLPFVCRIHRIHIRHRHAYGLALFKGFGCLDGAALIPEQQGYTCQEENTAGYYSLKGATEAAAPAFRCYFFYSHD